MATIQIRIDEQTKKKSAKILKELGLDTSSAINVFLKQVVLTRSIPFPILTENGLTVQQEEEILQASKEAEQGIHMSPPLRTEKEMMDYLNKLK